MKENFPTTLDDFLQSLAKIQLVFNLKEVLVLWLNEEMDMVMLVSEQNL